jgi:arsenite/tail-anchored protein-transporting ATPase
VIGELLPPEARLLFVGGKGGVGKTTIAASLAIAGARTRKGRVLILSTDPAHSLGDAFAVELGDEPRTIRGGPKNLYARELDAAAAYAKKRDRYREAVDELFTTLAGRGGTFDVAFDRAVLRDLFDLAPPGLDELFAVVEVIDALPEHALIIVDTAPTGHTLRLLEVPAMALDWVHTFMRIVLKYREVIGLGDLATELLDLSRQLHELQTLLKDPKRAGFITVTRAAALPRLETTRLLAALDRMEIPSRAVVVNAITPKGCARCRRARMIEAREVRKLEQTTDTAIILTPARAIPPRGVRALESFGETWVTRAS